jgi:hypothetical protein
MALTLTDDGAISGLDELSDFLKRGLIARAEFRHFVEVSGQLWRLEINSDAAVLTGDCVATYYLSDDLLKLLVTGRARDRNFQHVD